MARFLARYAAGVTSPGYPINNGDLERVNLVMLRGDPDRRDSAPVFIFTASLRDMRQFLGVYNRFRARRRNNASLSGMRWAVPGGHPRMAHCLRGADYGSVSDVARGDR